MATLVLTESMPLEQATVIQLVREAVQLNRILGNPSVLTPCP
jgi:hypothetical protein